MLAHSDRDALLAIERREVFSLYAELRCLLYLGVALLVSGIGLYLKENVYRLGHLTIIAVIGACALASYFVVWVRDRDSESRVADEYILLLGSLLLSADVAYAESQYHLFDERWSFHLLILAVIHAAVAYRFDSRIVLSVAITSLGAFLGAQLSSGDPLVRLERLFSMETELGTRLMLTALVLLVWRLLSRREFFRTTFDHFIVNFALAGALAWSFDNSREWLGVLLLAVFTTLTLRHAFRERSTLLAVYAVAWATAAAIHLVERHGDRSVNPLMELGIVTAALVALFMIHSRIRADP